MIDKRRVHPMSDFVLTRRQFLSVVASGTLAVGTHPRANAEQTDGREFTPPGRPKPHVYVGTLGHRGHGKMTLTAAIDKVMAERYGGEAKGLEEIRDVAPAREGGITVATVNLEYESQTRQYTHVYQPEHADYLKNMIVGSAQMDGGILVVSAVDGPMPQTSEHILLARETGVPYIVVYLNDADMVDDPGRRRIVEAEVRELLSRSGYPGMEVPIIRGSALKALEGDPSELGTESIVKLVAAMDSYIVPHRQGIDGPFLMPIEDVFSIRGRGTVVTGRVERGIIKVGDEVEIVGINKTSRTVCTGVERFRKLLDEARAGDNVGLLLRDTKKEEVTRGQVLAAPGTIAPHTKFEAEVYILRKDEGGRHTPFLDGYQPQFYFRTTDVTGTCHLPGDVELVMPGDKVRLTVSLEAPIAMDEGLRFAIREGGRTVGAGIVSEIIE